MSFITAIIPAAGQGRRMGMSRNKQYLLLGQQPIIAHTLGVFQKSAEIREIIVAVRDEEVEYCQKEIIERYGFTKVNRVIAGGAERQDTVYQALQVVTQNCTLVVVHDGARPFLSSSVLTNTISAAAEYGAAVAAVPVKDTMKLSNEAGFVQATLPRDQLWAVQTPQVFRYSLLLEAMIRACSDKFYATDDAALVEHYDFPVKLVPGDYANIKITTPDDLRVAAVIMEGREVGAGRNRL